MKPVTTMVCLDARVSFSIEVALTSDLADPALCQVQDARGRRLGMTGAEIDAARRGGSFDVRTSVAIALALAVGSSDELGRKRHRMRCREIGITEVACDRIEDLARSLCPVLPGKRHDHAEID